MRVIEGTGKCYEDSGVILYIILNASALLYIYFLTPLCCCKFLRLWFQLSIKKKLRDLFHREALFSGKNKSDNKNTCYVHDLLAKDVND